MALIPKPKAKLTSVAGAKARAKVNEKRATALKPGKNEPDAFTVRSGLPKETYRLRKEPKGG